MHEIHIRTCIWSMKASSLSHVLLSKLTGCIHTRLATHSWLRECSPFWPLSTESFGLCFLLSSHCMFDVKKIVVFAISYVVITWGNFDFLPLMWRSMHFMLSNDVEIMFMCECIGRFKTAISYSHQTPTLIALHGTWPTKRLLCILYSSAMGTTLCRKVYILYIASSIECVCFLWFLEVEQDSRWDMTWHILFVDASWLKQIGNYKFRRPWVVFRSLASL